jgi:hypothetical protein
VNVEACSLLCFAGRMAHAKISKYWHFLKRTIRMTAVDQKGLRLAMGGQVSLLQGFRATSALPVDVSRRGVGSGP